jgi:hypothetical protein
MQTSRDFVEGPEAFKRFTSAMKHVLSVPRETVLKKIEEHRKEVAANPNRRGPKSKPR